jgi:hypothetical protein
MKNVCRVWNGIWDWIDRRMIIRRAMTLGTFGLCVQFQFWCIDFAKTSPRSGAEIALILGAVGTPLNALMGYMLAVYRDSRKEA